MITIYKKFFSGSFLCSYVLHHEYARVDCRLSANLHMRWICVLLWRVPMRSDDQPLRNRQITHVLEMIWCEYMCVCMCKRRHGFHAKRRCTLLDHVKKVWFEILPSRDSRCLRLLSLTIYYYIDWRINCCDYGFSAILSVMTKPMQAARMR